MAVNNNFQRVAYGLSDALLNVSSAPIVSERAPTARDKAPFGQIWVDKPAQDAFILVSIVADSAVWVGVGGGAGSFTNVTATGFVHAGTNIQAGTTITAGTGLIATTGGVTASAGNIVATLGNIVASAGSITATLGSITAGTTVTAGTGITSLTGNIAATIGDVTAGSDIITAGGDIIAVVGDISANVGRVSGDTLTSAGDLGGVASSTSITNAVNTTQGAGTLTITSASANPGTNTGFLKFYVGTTAVFVPYFVTVAP